MADLFFSKSKLVAVVPFIVFTPQKYILNQSTLYHLYRDTVILWYVCTKQPGACEPTQQNCYIPL